MISLGLYRAAVLALAAECALLFNSCGIVPLGTATVNDPTPQGTIIAQGTFSAANGQTASGSASVYLSNTGGYVIRLDGLETTQETGLLVHGIDQSGNAVFSQGLRQFGGAQNYAFNGSITGRWTSINIFSTATQQNYAIATLIYPNGP